MATKYDWGDGKGKVHTISLAQHERNMNATGGPLGQAFVRAAENTALNATGGPLGQQFVQAANDAALNATGGPLGQALVAAAYPNGMPPGGNPLPDPGVPESQPFVPGAEAEPPDPATQAAALQASQNIRLGDAEAAWQTGQLQRSSGIDASGNLVTSGQDFNPYSQAMLLQDGYKRSQLGTTNGMAARGQLYSGAYGRAQGHNDSSYAQSYDALRTGTLTGYHGIQTNRLGTYGSNVQGAGSTDFNSLYGRLYGS